jgi:putative ABC transport system permease protein
MRLSALFRRARLDREQNEELRFHLDMQTEKLMKQGMSREAAARQARIALGATPVAISEDTHDVRGTSGMDDIGRDVVFGLRQLRRSPGFSVAAVLTLALGIGATTAIFSVLNGVLLRPSPFAHSDRLVMLWETDTRSGTTREPGAWPDYIDFRDRTRTFDALAAFVGSEVNLAMEGRDPVRIAGMRTTHNYLDVVGMRPLIGRYFNAAEDQPGGAKVVVLGENLWRTTFDASPAVIGTTIRLDEESWEVVGVVPDGADFGMDQIHSKAAYHGAYSGDGVVSLWAPLQANEAQYSRDTHPFLLLGRLGPGASVAAAQTEFAAIAADLERTYPSNTARGAYVEALGEVVFAGSRPTLFLLMGVVVLLLIVSCVNVANLLLARGASRGRELAVRRAIGATGRRIERQMLAESFTLAALGGLAGIGVAFVGLRLIVAFAPNDIPRVANAGIDLPVLGVTLITSIIVGLLFGMMPALQSRGADLISALRGDAPNASLSPARRRLGNGLVIGELALAVSLAVCAGLLLRSFQSVLGISPGFNPEQVYKAQYELPTTRYPRDFSKWPNWTEHHRVREAIVDGGRAIPGTAAVAVAGAHPLNAGFTNSWQVIGREAEGTDWPEISVRFTTAGYFETVQAQLVRGRGFELSDDASNAPVVLINQAAADRFFVNQEPIGQQLRFWGIARRIVGVVGNERIKGLTVAVPPITYAPLAQNPGNSGVLLVRSSADPQTVMAAMARVIRDVDPQLAVYGVEPLEATLLASVGERRFALYLVGAFAAVTVLLAMIGVHGLVSYLAAQRTKEMGIRMALGATGRSVIGLVLRGTLALAGIGIVVGLALAAAGSRLISGLLYGVSELDVITYLVVAGAVVLAATVAGLVPAVRAARTAPITATRGD